VHLGPHLIGSDAAFVPQHDQLIDQIRAFPDDTARTVAHGRESYFTGLFDQFLRDLAPPAGEQARGARMVFFVDAIEGVVKSGYFCCIRPDLSIIAGKHHL
jgi:hypothetical protein